MFTICEIRMYRHYIFIQSKDIWFHVSISSVWSFFNNKRDVIIRPSLFSASYFSWNYSRQIKIADVPHRSIESAKERRKNNTEIFFMCHNKHFRFIDSIEEKFRLHNVENRNSLEQVIYQYTLGMYESVFLNEAC